MRSGWRRSWWLEAGPKPGGGVCLEGRRLERSCAMVVAAKSGQRSEDPRALTQGEKPEVQEGT